MGKLFRMVATIVSRSVWTKVLWVALRVSARGDAGDEVRVEVVSYVRWVAEECSMTWRHIEAVF